MRSPSTLLNNITYTARILSQTVLKKSYRLYCKEIFIRYEECRFNSHYPIIVRLLLIFERPV